MFSLKFSLQLSAICLAAHAGLLAAAEGAPEPLTADSVEAAAPSETPTPRKARSTNRLRRKVDQGPAIPAPRYEDWEKPSQASDSAVKTSESGETGEKSSDPKPEEPKAETGTSASNTAEIHSECDSPQCDPPEMLAEIAETSPLSQPKIGGRILRRAPLMISEPSSTGGQSALSVPDTNERTAEISFPEKIERLPKTKRGNGVVIKSTQSQVRYPKTAYQADYAIPNSKEPGVLEDDHVRTTSANLEEESTPKKFREISPGEKLPEGYILNPFYKPSASRSKKTASSASNRTRRSTAPTQR